MSLTKHLLFTAVAGGIGYAATNSLALMLGIMLGGVLLDADHYFDYVVLDRQFNLSPFQLLRYFRYCTPPRRMLLLHSYELFVPLIIFVITTRSLLVAGYAMGAAMHLIFDVLSNGHNELRRTLRFYSFFYRWRQGFRSSRLYAKTES